MAKKYIADNIDLASDLSMASSSSGEQKIVIGNTDGAQTTNDYSKIHLTGKSSISSSLVGAEINLNTGGSGAARVNFNSSFSYSNTGSYRNARIGYIGGNNDDFYVQQIDGSTASNNAGFIITTADVRLIGDGIKIGGTATANRLDDYEEGTYNIAFRLYRDNNSDQELISSAGFAQWTNRSKYQKIGNTVTLFLDLEYRDGTSSKWNTSNTYFVGLDNLPFDYTQPATNTRVPVGGTYALRSTYQSINTGQTIFTREGGYSNYSVYISFGGILHSQYPSYALDPVYSNEWPQTRRYYYTEPVHLTGIVTYQTNE